jgi:poly-gamma-glutamate synthesis protein (capsule biosynthesis protein)
VLAADGTKEGGEADKTVLLFTGDILLDRGVRQYIEHRGTDALFTKQMDALLHSANIVVGNLECPATKIKAPVQKRYIFRAEPEWLLPLKKHGFTHLNLANNHAIDQGREGLTDTWENIVRAGMKPIGAGATLKEAAEPVLLTSRPRKVWLVPSLRLALENWAYLQNRPTVSQEPMDSLISRIRKIKKADSAAIVIVSLHWGGEHTLQPVPQQRLEAHQLINAGADALVCHHTHTLQTIESYKGKSIYYSIGNFIFDQQKPLNSKACMVRITIDKKGMKTETIPIIIKNCRPELQNL